MPPRKYKRKRKDTAIARAKSASSTTSSTTSQQARRSKAARTAAVVAQRADHSNEDDAGTNDGDGDRDDDDGDDDDDDDNDDDDDDAVIVASVDAGSAATDAAVTSASRGANQSSSTSSVRRRTSRIEFSRPEQAITLDVRDRDMREEQITVVYQFTDSTDHPHVVDLVVPITTQETAFMGRLDTSNVYYANKANLLELLRLSNPDIDSIQSFMIHSINDIMTGSRENRLWSDIKPAFEYVPIRLRMIESNPFFTTTLLLRRITHSQSITEHEKPYAPPLQRIGEVIDRNNEWIVYKNSHSRRDTVRAMGISPATHADDASLSAFFESPAGVQLFDGNLDTPISEVRRARNNAKKNR
jgi:hypothetical protein